MDQPARAPGDIAGKTKPTSPIRRQAIVVIHGVGNQRPMDVLRPFVDAVLEADPANKTNGKYYSKPENLSDIFETRRLQSRTSRPRTDYFELYWQHLVPTANWEKVYAWFALLLGRSHVDVPRPLRVLWWSSWVIVIVVAALLLVSTAAWMFPGLLHAADWQPTGFKVPLGLSILLLLLQSLVLNYVGDAASYLSPLPRNIRARQAVREAGVALIERLHKGLDDQHAYDRIVIVGHSLGSVIGYDILARAWPRFNEAHGRPESPTQDALLAAERAAIRLSEASGQQADRELREASTEWAAATRELWFEQRANRFPWCITDFITLGSPLTHGLLLLARNREEFERKKAERELPTSPPTLERQGFSYPCRYTLDGGTPGTTFALHHAALFAVTRWTNLYFPVRLGLKGDPIGGAIAESFGPGVIDVPVQTATRGGWLAHTCYWQPHALDRKNAQSAIVRLTKALDLTCRGFRRAKP